MKFKLTVLLAAVVVTMGLLLGTSAAQEAEVIFDPGDPGKAIGITNLDIGGTSYDVAFDEQSAAFGLYGELPGVFDFTTSDSANEAINAVIVELNEENAQRVGEEGTGENKLQLSFFIGYDSDGEGLLAIANVYQASIDEGTWASLEPDILLWSGDERTYATFTQAGPAPAAAFLPGAVYLPLLLSP
jgi:hypothetical protein